MIDCVYVLKKIFYISRIGFGEVLLAKGRLSCQLYQLRYVPNLSIT